MRRESLQAQERHAHAARDSVEAGLGSRFARRVRFPMGREPPQGAVMAEDGVLSCWRSANPNDETERQLPGPQRAVGNGLFRGYSKNRDKRDNRLVGDCFLEPDKRVTKSVLRYWNVERQRNPNTWAIKPTICSGPSISDELQPSGLLGPVMLKRYE